MTAYKFDVIFTLEARSNSMLEAIIEQFGLSDCRVYEELQSAVARLRVMLAAKGVQYTDLKRALTPTTDRIERAFVFDWSRFSTVLYGHDVLHIMLPLLDKRSSCSLLVGDWTSKYRFADAFRESFGEGGNGSVLNSPQHTDSLYFVYLNNLTTTSASRLHARLSAHPAYLDSIDLTYTSTLKTILSTMLVRAFIQHRNTIIQGHEDDRDDCEDVNLAGYELEKNGYINRSVPLWLYDWFLSYKIERPVLRDDSDTRFSLNAMTPSPHALAKCVIELEESKLDHLRREKSGSLRRADFQTLSATEIGDQIRAKLAGSYIYNLSRAVDGDTLKFNIVIENGKLARSMCALEYRPTEQKLRVITFY